MSHGFELKPPPGPALPDHPALAAVARLLNLLNSALLKLSMAALVLRGRLSRQQTHRGVQGGPCTVCKQAQWRPASCMR